MLLSRNELRKKQLRFLVRLGHCFTEQEDLRFGLEEKMNDLLIFSKKHYKKYLIDGTVSDDLLKSCIFLAQLDEYLRSRRILDDLGHAESDDLNDLRNLYKLLTVENFECKKKGFLNPTFGDASSLVGGADTDLIIDNKLIDLKTTKNYRFSLNMWLQLVGYYVLSILGCVDGNKGYIKLNKLCIYYSRHGKLLEVSAPSEKIVREFFPKFKKKIN